MAQDDLTLTIRIHDPKEKQDSSKSASWVVIGVARSDVKLPLAAFIAKYIQPHLSELKSLSLT